MLRKLYFARPNKTASQDLLVNSRGGGGTPLYKLYRYVTPQRVWFSSPFSSEKGV